MSFCDSQSLWGVDYSPPYGRLRDERDENGKGDPRDPVLCRGKGIPGNSELLRTKGIER